MPKGTFNFPDKFLWGTATAAHQVEGNNTNNDFWAWEQEPGHILYDDKSGVACEWWAGRWCEDFDRAQETYQNAHRLSVEWARIQPAPDMWDEMALERYRQMLLGLKRTRHDCDGYSAPFYQPAVVSRNGRMGKRASGAALCGVHSKSRRSFGGTLPAVGHD